MIEKRYERRKCVSVENVLIFEKRYCNICKKEIKGHYWSCQTCHNDWGNDSIESVEDKDVCSPECLQKVFNEYLNVSNNSFNSQQIEVEHFNSSGVKGEIKEEDAEE